jgi:guanylate kinase
MNADSTNKTGRLFIISGPSGCGKTTIRLALLNRCPWLRYSVSCTTRPKRNGEADGEDYFFIPPAEFKSKIESGQWAEWAEVHGNFYGTSDIFINETLTAGKDLLLDIDVQGTRQILKRYPGSITIFILPPGLESLKARLESRATESRQAIERRLKDAQNEMRCKDLYRYRIVNDNLDEAISEVVRIIESHREGRRD